MESAKRSFVFVAAVMSVTLSAVSAHGFEFNVSASTTFSYVYYSQMGKRGFFGPYNLDASSASNSFFVSSPGDAAVANGWLGVAQGLVSGSD